MAVTLSELMRGIRTDGADSVADIPEDWTQGRSVFGGLQAAIALAAMRSKAPDMPLRTLQATFMAPVPPGTVRATAAVLRTGKNTAHVESKLVDAANTLATLIGVFGVARKSAVSVVPAQPKVEVPAQPIDFRYLPGITPGFTQFFRSRWLRGVPPFVGDKGTEQVLELSMIDEGNATEAHVLSIADFIAPIALSHMTVPAPGSTLTWMIEFLRDRFDDLPLTGWRVDAQLFAARDGYTVQSVMVWGPGGAPVARSQQTMVVFG